MSDTVPPRRDIPRPALVLGWAGVIPFAALTAALLARIDLPLAPVPALVGYGCAILSFMGGAQWGLAVRSPDDADARLAPYAICVLPALLAWCALFLPWRAGLLGLALGFVGLLSYDLWTVRHGRAPPWYGRLRLQLTSAVVLLLAAAASA